MEINEKKKKKEQQELIIRKYQQYLKLEKSLSPNTLEAYLTDLDKLMSFLTLEGINVLEVCLSDLQRFTAGLHDIGIHPRSQARILLFKGCGPFSTTKNCLLNRKKLRQNGILSCIV